MVLKKNKIAITFFILSLVSVCDINANKSDFWDNVTKIACGVGAAAFGVASAVKLASWYFDETDEQLLSRACSEYETVTTHYKDAVKHFESLVDYCGYPSRISENIVYALGEKIWDMNVDQQLYRRDLCSWCKKLETTAQLLRKRIVHIQNSENGNQWIIPKMERQAEVIAAFLMRLQPYSEVLDCHETFYELSWKEGHLQKYYKEELKLLSAGYSGAVLGSMLGRCAVAHHTWSTYPCIDYVKQLESDIASLSRSLNRLAHHYPTRVSYAKHFIDSLEYIKIAMVSDLAYSKELFAKQQAELEKARQAAAFAEMKANCARLEAERERVEAHCARLQAKRERAKLMHERNNMLNAYCCEEMCENASCCNSVCNGSLCLDVTVNL